MLREQLKVVRIPEESCDCPVWDTYHSPNCEYTKLAKTKVRVREDEPSQSYPNGCPILE